MDYLKIYRDKRSLYSLNVELIYILVHQEPNQVKSLKSIFKDNFMQSTCISMNSHMYQCAYSSIHSPNQNNQHSLHPKMHICPCLTSKITIYVYIKQWKHIRVLAICVLEKYCLVYFVSPFKTNKIFYF